MSTFIRCLVLVSASLIAIDGQTASIYEKGDLIVNVNTATPKELESIPCIGATLAREIIKGRPYDKVEDLPKVDGIGDYTYKCMLPFVKVEGPTERRKKPK